MCRIFKKRDENRFENISESFYLLCQNDMILLYAQTFRKLCRKKFETIFWYFFSTCCVRGVCFTCCVRGGENVEEGGREDGPDGEGPEPIRC